MSYQILFSKQAEKDVRVLTPKLKDKLKRILSEIIGRDPYVGKKLVGELAGSYSFRLTYQDRIVYSIDSHKKIIYIERAKTHYGE